MKRCRFAFAPIVLALWFSGAQAQVPGGDGLAINVTPVTGGTNSQCLYINNGRVGATSCGASGTVASVSVTTQNGVSASVTNPTTTPALAFTLGAITPSTVAIGAGSAITSSGAGGALTALAFTSPGTGVATALGNTAGGAGGFALVGTTPPTGSAGGDLTGTYPNPTLAAIISAGGPTGSATVAPIITYDAKGRLTAVSSATITPAVGNITGLGTGVATALGVNIGSAGAFVTFNGAGGTPSSMTATNLTGTAAGLTAGAVTTNANLTGDVTSVGNATTFAAGSASNLNSGTLAAARGGAGTINGALKGNGSGVVSQAACTDLSNGATGCSTVVGTIATQNYTATTWTPAITASVTPGTPAYVANGQTGAYEIIGRQVTVRFFINLSGWTGTPVGNITLTGLPVASANTTNNYGSCVISNYSVAGLATLNYGITGFISPNTSVINLTSSGNAGETTITAVHTGTTPQFLGYCVYNI